MLRASVARASLSSENLRRLLRMGTRRAVNPALGLAGDGVGPAQLDALRRLCAANPRVKVLATVLSPSDQHEATVLAPTACRVLPAAHLLSLLLLT